MALRILWQNLLAFLLIVLGVNTVIQHQSTPELMLGLLLIGVGMGMVIRTFLEPYIAKMERAKEKEQEQPPKRRPTPKVEGHKNQTATSRAQIPPAAQIPVVKRVIFIVGTLAALLLFVLSWFLRSLPLALVALLIAVWLRPFWAAVDRNVRARLMAIARQRE